MYIKLPDIYPYNLSQIRKDFPDVSFPRELHLADLHDYGVYPVLETEKPSGDVVTEVLPELINGEWVQTWTARDYTAEEIAARVPKIVTMRQARLALHQLDLLGTVEAAVANAGADVQIEWEYSGTVDRSHPWVQSLGASLALDLNDLFTAAAKL